MKRGPKFGSVLAGVIWAAMLAGGCGGNAARLPICAHNPCRTSTQPLNAACDTCVGKICAAYPDCCNVGWTQVCVDSVQTICTKRCDCENAFTATPTIPFERYACDCTKSVCTGSQASCCDTGWAQACVDAAMSVYATGCTLAP